MQTVANTSGVTMGEKPPGIEGAGFFATSLEKVVGMWAMQPLPRGYRLDGKGAASPGIRPRQNERYGPAG